MTPPIKLPPKAATDAEAARVRSRGIGVFLGIVYGHVARERAKALARATTEAASGATVSGHRACPRRPGTTEPQ